MTTILVVVPDLFFATRIEETAKKLGYATEALRANESVSDALARTSAKLVVVSLDAPNALAVIAEAKRAQARTLAFGSHMNVELFKAARDAGCDQVVARSLLNSDLPNLLQKWASEK